MVPEAELKETEAGLVPVSVGWFVMNARDAGWFHRPGRDSLPLTGCDEFEAETYFPMLGMSIQALSPGEPKGRGPWGYYTVDEVARRYDACPDVETQDTGVAYARVPPSQPTRYRDGSLPPVTRPPPSSDEGCESNRRRVAQPVVGARFGRCPPE